jgi:hypothetical protein
VLHKWVLETLHIAQQRAAHQNLTFALPVCRCRLAMSFIEHCVPVVAGTFNVGHTLERLIQLRQAPAWASNLHHLTAARAATGYLHFEHLLVWRPQLLDSLQWLKAEASAKQQEVQQLLQELAAEAGGLRATPLLCSAAADAAMLRLLADCGALKTLATLPALRHQVKQQLQNAATNSDRNLYMGIQQPSVSWVKRYRTWLQGVLLRATTQAAEPLLPVRKLEGNNAVLDLSAEARRLVNAVGKEAKIGASSSYAERQLQLLQIILSNNLICLRQPFIRSAVDQLLGWEAGGRSLAQEAAEKTQQLQQDLLPSVQEAAAQLLAGVLDLRLGDSQPGSSAAAAVAAIQRAGGNVRTAGAQVFNRVSELACREPLWRCLRQIFFDNNVQTKNQQKYLCKE